MSDTDNAKVDADWARMKAMNVDLMITITELREQLADRPSLAKLRDVAMAHSTWRLSGYRHPGMAGWICAGCDYHLDETPYGLGTAEVRRALADHQLAMMEES